MFFAPFSQIRTPHSLSQEGSVVEVDGFNMACGSILLAVTPRGRESPDNIELLRQCYRNALTIARERGYRSIAISILGNDSIRIDGKICAKLVA